MKLLTTFLSASCLLGTLCTSTPTPRPSNDTPPTPFHPLDYAPPTDGPLPPTLALPLADPSTDQYVLFKARLPPPNRPIARVYYGWVLLATHYRHDGAAWRAVAGSPVHLAQARLLAGEWTTDCRKFLRGWYMERAPEAIERYLPLGYVGRGAAVALFARISRVPAYDLARGDEEQGKLRWISRALDPFMGSTQ